MAALLQETGIDDSRPRGLERLAQGAHRPRFDQGGIDRKHEKGFYLCAQAGHAGNDRGEHPRLIIGIDDSSGAKPVKDRSERLGVVADHHPHVSHARAEEGAHGSLEHRAPSQRQQGLEGPHAARVAGSQNQGRQPVFIRSLFVRVHILLARFSTQMGRLAAHATGIIARTTRERPSASARAAPGPGRARRPRPPRRAAHSPDSARLRQREQRPNRALVRPAQCRDQSGNS